MTMEIIEHILSFHTYILGAISLDEVIEAEKKYHALLKNYWHHSNYLTWRWWFLVILSILPAIVWWFVVDKRNIIEITAYGLFYGVAAIILDSIGSNAMVWTYPVRLSPYINPQLYPYDVGVVIIPFMLIYQKWGGSFKSFLIATGLLSCFLSFIAEPSMEWLGIYKEYTWKHIYSFPVYWVLGLVCWKIISEFKSQEQKKRKNA